MKWGARAAALGPAIVIVSLYSGKPLDSIPGASKMTASRRKVKGGGKEGVVALRREGGKDSVGEEEE